MIPSPPPLTDDIVAAYLKCRYKAYLKLQGAAGEQSDYELLQARLAAEYRAAVRTNLLQRHGESAVIQDPDSLRQAIRSGAPLILGATALDADESCHLDGLERAAGQRPDSGEAYIPVLFTPHERATTEDRLRLAFAASVLARLQGDQPTVGRIIHGRQFKPSKVNLPKLVGKVSDVVGGIRAIQASATPPPLLLNRHCAECEFLRSCRARAVEKDDLSLLRGLLPKEIAALNRRGIFTVTQYSHTFRPGRMRRVAAKRGGKHDLSLQALALREKKIYVARRPQLPDGPIRIYLDVEGLPDRDFYYLIGLSWDDGTGVRQASFWADQEGGEAAIWDAFLRAVRGVGDDFALFHYGSYEAQFLRRMERRHGGDPGLIAQIKARCVNVLSAIHAQVYFPVYSNDLKSVAECLGIRWTATGSSGLQSIVWRDEWEVTGSDAAKQRLLVYNQEDRAALARIEEVLRSLAHGAVPAGGEPCPEIAGIEDIKTPRRHKFCDPEYVLPEFAQVAKCAYFDYQRDRVLFRTSPAVRRANRRKKRGVRAACAVNRVVECARLDRCPQCGSDDLDSRKSNRWLVVDLKRTPGGLRRWVTRYKARQCRCRKCEHVALPDEFLAVRSHKFGSALCGWVAYATVALRQTTQATADALGDMFGVRITASAVSRLRTRAADRYRGTYESLLDQLRAGRLAHADETWARVKGRGDKCYVWAFASPEVAVYVYSPTREGGTVQDTLRGFRGVLVSDFYAAYDSLDCPQQKCLIHLVRDLNDDLAKNPFDGELKQLAARFGSLMQSVVVTIDRYGLKKRHLGKHKPDVDAFFSSESAASYGSELARHYRHRLLKYQDRLFTFLDHDGVPWNNNNAENAVKRFVSRRKGMEGTGAYCEQGLRDYLVLLSIYQTLRYRGLGFWKFLLSGETDIAAFTARSR